MTKYIFKYLHATSEDAQLLLNWRNDPLTCKNSLEKGPVKQEDHIKWFNSSLANPKRELYIVTIDNNPIGTVRFDCIDSNSWELSWTVAPEYRGKGYGKDMIKQATELRPESLIATILEENIPSIKIAQYAGFEIDSSPSQGILKLKLFKTHSENV